MSENTVYRLKILGGIAVLGVMITSFLIVYQPGFQEQLEIILRNTATLLGLR